MGSVRKIKEKLVNSIYLTIIFGYLSWKNNLSKIKEINKKKMKGNWNLVRI